VQLPDRLLDLHVGQSRLALVSDSATDRPADNTSDSPRRPFPDVLEVVVEIPSGSRNKYEYDESAGVLRLDRVLSSAVFYNFEYGYVEGTRADDGDHTDAMVLLAEPTFPGCRVWARPVGGLRMRDDKGDDFKVLCVALGDPLWEHATRLEQVSPHRLREIEHFFATYKLLEDKQVEVYGWADAGAALDLLRADRERWLDEHARSVELQP
jgi:inorganic pyrophosphatase